MLKIGIRVGVEKWNSWIEPEDVGARKEEIANAVSQLMSDGEEGQNIRTRAKELSKMARKTVKEGGSSYENLTALINELKMVNKSDLTRQ